MKSMSKTIRSNEHYLDQYDERIKDKNRIDLNDLQAKDIMTSGYVSIDETGTVQEAVKMFMEENVLSLLVVDKKERPIGTFSEFELANFDCDRPELDVTKEDVWLLNSLHDLDTPEIESMRLVTTTNDLVKDWMLPKIFTVNHDDDVDTICQSLIKNQTRRVFVKNNYRIVGVVSAMDVISAISSVTTKRKERVYVT